MNKSRKLIILAIVLLLLCGTLAVYALGASATAPEVHEHVHDENCY